MARRVNNKVSPLSDAPIRGRSRKSPSHPFCQRGINGGFLSALAAVLFMLAGTVALSAPASAQVSKEFHLKAVFLWRLAQFTQWSSDAFERPDSPIAICVLGENPFGDALEAAVRGETAHGRNFIVRHHRAVDQVKSCHILFIAGAGPRQAKDISAALAGRSVLTVSDSDGLPSTYETIIRFITEQNKIRLRINVKAAAAARLALDSRLLRAAEVVGE